MRLADATRHLKQHGLRVSIRPRIGRDPPFVPDYAMEGHGRRVAVLYAEQPVDEKTLNSFTQEAQAHGHEPWLMGPETTQLRRQAQRARIHFEPLPPAEVDAGRPHPSQQPRYRIRGQEPRRWLWIVVLWLVALSFVGWSLARVV